MRKLLSFSITVLLLQLLILSANAQSWKFIKEKEGFRLYTRQEGNSSFKSFRGEAEIRADKDKVSSMIGNPSNLDWWGDDVHDIRVIAYEKDRHIRYYFVYDVPWPFTNRDLVADVTISEDSATGIRTVYSHPLTDAVPEKPGLIRVTNYWQKWTIQPLTNGMIHLTLEGFIDPAGSVPAWLYNMVIIDTPLRLLREVQKRVQTEQNPG